MQNKNYIDINYALKIKSCITIFNCLLLPKIRNNVHEKIIIYCLRICNIIL